MRADPWILNDLPERLVDDWYDRYIFNEHDMQVATYYWLRRHFDRYRSEPWSVRAQPVLELRAGGCVKPDIVIYRNTLPYDIIELKCQLEGIRFELLNSDVEKLRALKAENIRHAYQLVLYDRDEVWDIPSATKKPWMQQYLTFVGANVRRHTTGRLRRGYEAGRKQWERWKSH